MSQRINKKAVGKGLIITVIVSLLSLGFISFLSSSGETWSALTRVSKIHVFYGILSIFSVWIVQALRIEVLARSFKQGVGLIYALKVYLAASFVAHVTPFSSGGIPVEIYLLHRKGISLAQSSAIILVQGSLTALFLLVASPVLLYLWRQQVNYAFGANAAFGIVLVIVAVLVYIFVKPEITKKVLSSILLKGPLGLLTKSPNRKKIVLNFIERSYASVKQFSESLTHLWTDQKLVLVLSSLLTGLYWICYLAVVPIILSGLGLKVSIVHAVLPQLVFNLLQAFIPTPGGSGGAELGFASMYTKVIPGSLITTFVLLWRFMTFYLSLVVGGIVVAGMVKELNDAD